MLHPLLFMEACALDWAKPYINDKVKGRKLREYKNCHYLSVTISMTIISCRGYSSILLTSHVCFSLSVALFGSTESEIRKHSQHRHLSSFATTLPVSCYTLQIALSLGSTNTMSILFINVLFGDIRACYTLLKFFLKDTYF